MPHLMVMPWANISTGSNPNGSGVVEIDVPVPCNATLAGIEVDIFANPAKDITVPYIVSVAAGGQTDVINNDLITSKCQYRHHQHRV